MPCWTATAPTPTPNCGSAPTSCCCCGSSRGQAAHQHFAGSGPAAFHDLDLAPDQEDGGSNAADQAQRPRRIAVQADAGAEV